ncbi:MAG TPA: type II 3-dehydroquinate dehydratase [Myxococcaceae bacterium]|nr:type II 3-dehydroquinate dehydratase [Myxococcaceae bacterium]
MRILVLHGPNLNLLGERRPEVYGKTTLAQLNALLRKWARPLGHQLRIFQSNHEGALIDKLHAQRRWMEALVINPGALTHYSYAVRDAIEAVQVRTYEVHLSDIHAREPWRRVSVIAEIAEGQIVGKGIDSYREALERLALKRPGGPDE